ncbi:procyclic form-specific polypeptide A-beta-like isoform X2 [Macrobrachium nipponense]|uniref:procyclic form-specific polypeptide A-beta-like isoform X2 n=1 Tax=Macrobrachium nipponense TaxID=159736 RepID=UPI0030C7CD38
MVVRSLALFLVLIFAFLPSAKAEGGVGEPCQQDSDCLGTLVCNGATNKCYAVEEVLVPEPEIPPEPEQGPGPEPAPPPGPEPVPPPGPEPAPPPGLEPVHHQGQNLSHTRTSATTRASRSRRTLSTRL